MAYCNAHQIDDTNWLLSVGVNKQQDLLKDGYNKKRVALHYVVDNSGSMGSMTNEVRNIFSEMVDSVATAPSSMTIFGTTAEILSSNITSGEQMRSLTLPPQSCTNIPAGVEKALRIIYGQEQKSCSKNESSRIHHILILLSDGEHNSGPEPKRAFPKLNSIVPDDIKLSVVVVGYSRHSNTSMGMLLKKSVETIPLSAEDVKTIYFARNSTTLRSTLEELEVGLNIALKGSVHEIKAENDILISNFGTGKTASLQIHLATEECTYPLLCCADELPETLTVDEDEIKVVLAEEDLSEMLLSDLIQNLIDKTKVQIVASSNNGSIIAKTCAKKLEVLVEVLESKSAGKKDLKLQSVSAKDRVRQYRNIRSVCQQAKELKNQIIDIANFSSQDSEKAANFLNGRSMKYANKALRRATKNSDGVLDPVAERRSMVKDLTSTEFQEKLRLAMYQDVLNNLMYLSDSHFDELKNEVSGRCRADMANLKSLRSKLKNEEEISFDFFKSLNTSQTNLVSSGRLAEYLNEFLHGNRRSYVSLSSPWQHIEEWTQFNYQTFESSWELLMYGGFLGYPLLLERSAASQMNPYLTEVKGLHLSLVDTASICCANQAEYPVYGPEGGEPIKDVLPLIDPSMPRSSRMICGSKLLGQKYTSAVIARDLHMYTGFNMQIALYSNTLLHVIAAPEREGREDIIANLQRTFMDRAFMCAQCGFGPVDHYACSDLQAHNGERHGHARVSNACPNCGWFSSSISNWKKWDGNVCEKFIAAELESLSKYERNRMHIPQAKIEVILRILYSFRKMSSASVIEEYADIAARIMKGAIDGTAEDLDLSAKSGIEGMSQVLLAMFCADGDICNSFLDALKQSEGCVLSIIQEACLREARQIFRMKSGGDKMKAKKMAFQFLTKLLGVTDESAPYTSSLMESERPVDNVRMDCDDSIHLDSQMAHDQMNWVRKIAKQWCHAWSFVRGFHDIVQKGNMSWEKIEHNMESGLQSYSDMVEKLQNIKLETPKECFGLSDSAEAQSLFLNIGVAAIFAGVFGEPLQSSAFPLLQGNDGCDSDVDILHEAAREIRMKIYFGRVQDKLAEWKTVGEDRIFFEARAADINAFQGMLGGHVHGLDKPTFWGLWKAAKNTKNEEKVLSFLSTANEAFFLKHYNGKVLSVNSDD
eukprot:CAMPEP_0203685570 /NCGR_PEP_ID=MMETSP0090-20130426/48615_1 /ASSEMBLY_ACC=CAM_ASM_001088 /TAXON_ID=426623 /ORGANISM="Chaetoceros affinis, Strain CCMP159" /LENGTH=1159 /DNA_ID=CAMNT_0050554767 /DNA_START=184 /DNA_END=3663 /DNA_ORIENTATION=+